MIYSKLTNFLESEGFWKPTLFRGYILDLIGFLSYSYKNISILHQIPIWAMVFRIGKPPQPTLNTLTMLNKILYNAGKILLSSILTKIEEHYSKIKLQYTD